MCPDSEEEAQPSAIFLRRRLSWLPDGPRGCKSSCVLKPEGAKKQHKRHFKRTRARSASGEVAPCDYEARGTPLRGNFSFIGITHYSIKADYSYSSTNQGALLL